jgi:hypothetical protein
MGVAGAAMSAGRNWERGSFPDWPAEHVDRILTDSPWARPLTLPYRLSLPPVRRALPVSEFAQIGEPLGLPKGWPGTGIPTGRGARAEDMAAPPVLTEIYLTARWASALPVRQAMALFQYGKSGVESARAVETLRDPGKEYVLELAGFPATAIVQGARRFEAELLESATLLMKGRKAVRATASSVPEHGNYLVATLRFPRMADLRPEEGHLTIAATAGPMAIEQKFKLREMTYRGRLEL